MTKFILVTDNDDLVFAKKINEKLNEGWELIGNTYLYNNHLTQNMVFRPEIKAVSPEKEPIAKTEKKETVK